jgi:anti-anti-sigma factor
VDRTNPELFSCRALSCGSSQRLVVTGEIDLASAGELTRFLADRIGAAAPGDRIRVDLAGVLFCAAVGVRALVGAARLAHSRGIVLSYEPHSPAVALALDICGHLELTGPVGPPADLVARCCARTGDRSGGDPSV